jgi:hypothetical protein
MTQDDPETRRSPSGRPRLVIGGMIGACALGLGLGVWARPEMATLEPPKPKAPPMQAVLQIVVDDTPAPIGPPMEVLPRDMHPPVRMLARSLPPPPAVQPFLRDERLVRVDAPAIMRPLLAPAVTKAPEAREPIHSFELRPKATEGRVRTSTTIVAAKAKEPTKVAKAPKAEPKLKPAKAESRPKVAKAEPKPEVKKKPDAKRIELAKAKPEPKRKLAKPQRKKAAELARASSKAPKAIDRPARKPPVEKAVVRKPPAKPKGEGPMRVARAGPCESHDPGEAMVCSDRRLGARDRQLQRALREAEAAGVPASALRRQQARLVVARAAAAREAPWAVEDVYEARISEVNDLIRDARDN